MRLARADAAGQIRNLDAMRAMRVEERVDLVRHVAVEAETPRRIGRVPRVLRQSSAIVDVALITRIIRIHPRLQQEVRVVPMHGVTRKATELTVAFLITRGERHTVVFECRRQRSAVAPESPIVWFGFQRSIALGPPPPEHRLFRFRPEEPVELGQLLARNKRVAMRDWIPIGGLRYQRPVTAGTNLIAASDREIGGLNDIVLARGLTCL